MNGIHLPSNDAPVEGRKGNNSNACKHTPEPDQEQRVSLHASWNGTENENGNWNWSRNRNVEKKYIRIFINNEPYNI